MLDILRKRCSVRKYKDEDIGLDIVEQLKEAALRSFTSRNFRPLALYLHHRQRQRQTRSPLLGAYAPMLFLPLETAQQPLMDFIITIYRMIGTLELNLPA